MSGFALVCFSYELEAQMPCRSRLVFFAVLSAVLSALAMEAHAASAPGGIDTPQGTITLPFSLQDNTEMTLTESGLGIGVGTAEPMNLTVSGLVGIGTTVPTAPLDVSTASNTGFLLSGAIDSGAPLRPLINNPNTSGGTLDAMLEFENPNHLYGLGVLGAQNGIAGYFGLYDWTNNHYDFVINTSGQIGIGMTSPTAPLDVNGGIRGSGSGITIGGGCSPEGMFGYDITDHQPVYCNNSGVWTALSDSAYMNRTWHYLGEASSSVSGTNNYGYPIELGGSCFGWSTGAYQCNAGIGGGINTGGAEETVQGIAGWMGWAPYDITVPPGASWWVQFVNGNTGATVFLLY